jgi:ribosomal protein S16
MTCSKYDDTIQIQLNKAGNQKEACRSVWETIVGTHRARQGQIQKCIDFYRPVVADLQAKVEEYAFLLLQMRFVVVVISRPCSTNC